MRALTSLSLAALLLAACGSQPPAPEQDPAGVESRKPGAVKVDTPPVTQVRPEQFDANSIAALKDPRSPLSKRSVYFDYDSYVVKDEFQALLGAHGKFLAGNPKMKMLIQGNADERGSREYNLALGQKRAEAVRKALSPARRPRRPARSREPGRGKAGLHRSDGRLLGQEPPRRHALLG
jgi:peptidoglycan-associated lipoprotein